MRRRSTELCAISESGQRKTVQQFFQISLPPQFFSKKYWIWLKNLRLLPSGAYLL